MLHRPTVLALALLLTACGKDSSGSGAGADSDAGRRDAGETRRDLGDDTDSGLVADAGGSDAGDGDGGGDDGGVHTGDAGPPVVCDSAALLSSALLGGVDLDLEIPSGRTDSCAEVAAGETIDGVLYFDVDLLPREGVQFLDSGIVAALLTDCESGCGPAIESSGYLNESDSPESIRVVVGARTSSTPFKPLVRFNRIEENVSCETAREVTVPTSVLDLNTLGAAERYDRMCTGVNFSTYKGSFLRTTIPAGATLVAEARGDDTELAPSGGLLLRPQAVISANCPGSDGDLTCIGEVSTTEGAWTYTNSSDGAEEVFVFVTTGTYPRADVELRFD